MQKRKNDSTVQRKDGFSSIEPKTEQAMNKPKRTIRFFTDEEITRLCEQRKALQAELTDKEISARLSASFGRHYGSLNEKINQLVKSGVLEENPNFRPREEFADNELEHIIRRRAELEAQGKNNNEISRIISGELGRTDNSIYMKMEKLVRAKHVKENRNKQTYDDYTAEEIQHITKRRAELMAQGLMDTTIGKKLASEMKGRSKGSLVSKIRSMRVAGELPPNPKLQNHTPYTAQDEEKIKSARAELIKEGFCDKEIAMLLSDELNRNVNQLSKKIHTMIKEGKLTANPNKKNHNLFSAAEIEKIRKRRDELIQQGLSDHVLSSILCTEMGRTLNSVSLKVQKLVRKGVLPKNPNAFSKTKPSSNGTSTLISAIEQYGVDDAEAKEAPLGSKDGGK